MAADPVDIARTESLFRDVNERIAETAKDLGSDRAVFVCECADPECDQRIEVELETYDSVRADGTRFLVVVGHEEPRYEKVLQGRSNLHVVSKDKDERLKRAVCDLDPRD
jgi:hypothetical protein